MCSKTLGQMFEALEDKITVLEERVEQLEAEQRAPVGWVPTERWDDPYAGDAYNGDGAL